jgi:hypothetical protein
VTRPARREPAAVFPRRRTTALVGSAACAAALVPVIELAWLGPLSWRLHGVLRSWGLHFFALYAAVIGTLLVLGFFHADSPRRRRGLRRLGVLTPLAVTLLHELGQSIWPHDQWELWDTVRDALLNVVGALLAWWLVRERVVSAPSAAPAAHNEAAPPALRR